MSQSKPFALVTVRVDSSRLNRKCLLEFGDGNVLEHVLRRSKWARFTPVVCTTEESADDVVQDIARSEGCLCFRGSVKDKLHRWLKACTEFGIEYFHTIDADDPFFDGELCHCSIELLCNGNYDLVYPSTKTYLASMGYSLTSELVKKACEIKVSEDTEMMWYHIEKVPGLKATELPVDDAVIRDVRLTLDYEEDYWLLRTVLRILGPRAERKDIERLFLQNPQLYLINWFRNEDWKNLQLAKKI